jgi:hypothetical protein
MGIDHRRIPIVMAQKFLNGSNLDSLDSRFCGNDSAFFIATHAPRGSRWSKKVNMSFTEKPMAKLGFWAVVAGAKGFA